MFYSLKIAKTKIIVPNRKIVKKNHTKSNRRWKREKALGKEKQKAGRRF